VQPCERGAISPAMFSSSTAKGSAPNTRKKPRISANGSQRQEPSSIGRAR
jgi:hypothetical protein